jgi:hypothetical protein
MEGTVLGKYGAKKEAVNLLEDETVSTGGGLPLEAYRSVWLDIS